MQPKREHLSGATEDCHPRRRLTTTSIGVLTMAVPILAVQFNRKISKAFAARDSLMALAREARARRNLRLCTQAVRCARALSHAALTALSKGGTGTNG